VSDLVACSHCGVEVPAGRFCVRCGEPQVAGAAADEAKGPATAAGGAGRRRMGSFAAAPNERVFGPSLVSTFFPRLPRSDLGSFRLGLALGIGLIAGLTLAGLYPVALGVAAAIVPALIVVYVYAVDVYEDEPLTVLVGTVAWGLVTGALFGFATAGLTATSPDTQPTLADALFQGVALPIVGGAIAVAGPLLLVRRPVFNDVLDGVTFGATAGSVFLGAQTLAGASGLLSGGLRPVGAAGPWLIQLLTVGVAQPILSAAVAAIVAGTIWLRARAPARDRTAMGPVSNPFVAILAGAVALGAAGLGRFILPSVAALGWLIVLAAIALIWMRLLIHLGLLQEAAEIEIGPPVVCPECGATTPHHTFCVSCGIALRALPRVPPPPTGEPGTAADAEPNADHGVVEPDGEDSP
jgi:ribosomal protein L32